MNKFLLEKCSTLIILNFAKGNYKMHKIELQNLVFIVNKLPCKLMQMDKYKKEINNISF